MKILPKIKDNTVKLETILPGNPFVIKRGSTNLQYYMRVERVSNNITVEKGFIPIVNLSTGGLGCYPGDVQVETIRMSVVQE